ncbi:MAG: hypothetical protein FJX51_04125 [Alphaproteobacteria bacterium]|nr:hypothetical protein [Alphaproteobacteria bacterium]
MRGRAIGTAWRGVAWAAAFELASALSPARAQTIEEALPLCQSPQPDIAFAGCTALIDLMHAPPALRAMAFHNRGLVRVGRREYPAGTLDLDAAASLSPQNAEYVFHTCWARALARREFRLAREACDAALRLAPGRAKFLDGRALLALVQGQYAEAWRDYDAALRAQPNDAHALFGRALAAQRQGRASDAQSDFARAAQADANVARVYQGYGLAP